MTLVGYKLALKKNQFQEVGRGILFILGFMVAGGLVIPLAKRIDKVGLDFWCLVFLIVWISVFAPFLFYVLARLPRKQLRRLGLLCPNCRKRLTGISAQVVIATGKCGGCGVMYLDL